MQLAALRQTGKPAFGELTAASRQHLCFPTVSWRRVGRTSGSRPLPAIRFPGSGTELRARQKIRCAFWHERRAGRCKAPRRRRCGGIVEERQRRRCPPAAAPLRAAARRPAGCVTRSVHTAAGMLVARALPAGLGASSKMYTLFPDGP